MAKPITVRDLKPGDNGAGKPFLYCRKCRARFSADARDYWSVAPETVVKCCGRPVVRAKEVREIVAA